MHGQHRVRTGSKASLLPAPPCTQQPLCKAKNETSALQNSDSPHRDLHFTFWPLLFALD